MKKVILVIVDGLGYEYAENRMGFLQHLVENRKATFHKVIGELPTLSRPMYETILTGKPVCIHGITQNSMSRLSNQRNIFKCVREKGLGTACAAYYWMSELYVNSPFNRLTDRFLNNLDKDIQHGIFYWAESYPDSHVYYDAEYLRREYSPEFLLIHTMGVDTAGHKYSRSSSEYRNSMLINDQYLAGMMNLWLEDDYVVLVTGDHGINDDFQHGGTLPCEREVPLWVIGENHIEIGNVISQLEIAPLVLKIMDVE